MAAAGCEHCRHTGFGGRAAIFEICMVSPRLQDMITQGRPESILRATAVDEGMIPLRHYGWNKVLAGYTTLEEVVRVTAADLERFWMRRRAMSFDELCRHDLSSSRPTAH